MAKRNTIQRQLVIAAVRTLADHPTAEEVYDRITVEYPDISKGTVYRNLNGLVESGLLNKVCIPNAADRFDYILTKHYHIKCTRCGLFSDVNMEYLKDLDAKIAKASGYLMESHDIVFNGLCKECQKMAEQETH
ncbi:MAG: transcriptional repressor [Acidaminococcaceae bacterium]